VTDPRPDRAGNPVADLLGGLLRGGRPGDRELRRGARKVGLVATLIALLAWLPWLLVRGDNRIDRVIEAQQRNVDRQDQNLREAVTAIHRLAAAVEAQTTEDREMRLILLSTDTKPASRKFSPRPVR